MTKRREQTVVVKVLDGTPPDTATELIRSLLPKKSVTAVEQLFPGDPDAVMGSIFNVKLASAASAAKVISALEHDDHVEYAHTPSTRNPTR